MLVLYVLTCESLLHLSSFAPTGWLVRAEV